MAAATRRSQRLRNSRREFDYKSLLIRDDPKEDASYRSHRKGESNTVATRGRRSAGPEPESIQSPKEGTSRPNLIEKKGKEGDSGHRQRISAKRLQQGTWEQHIRMSGRVYADLHGNEKIELEFSATDFPTIYIEVAEDEEVRLKELFLAFISISHQEREDRWKNNFQVYLEEIQ